MSTARFWLRDIWGPQWDAERRALLLQHYWSYACHPAVPPVYLPADDAASRQRQRAFSQKYRARIERVQQHAGRDRTVRLTYRPIGKNIRLVGTAIRRNADRGVATVIAAAGPPTEARALAAKGHAWDPWVWSRAAVDARTAADGAWGMFFERPGDGRDANGGIALPPVPSLVAGNHVLSDAQLERVLKLAVATHYAFAPVASLADEAARLQREMSWPADGAPVLGLHVRRSDGASAEEDAPRKSNRASFGIARYLEAADRVCEGYGIRHIFLATESSIEIERARRLRPQYTFLTVPHDRALFPDISINGQYIEELALQDPERAYALARTAILDLQMFRGCQAFVGAFNSEFSVLAWLLTIGAGGDVAPFISLSEPAPRLRLHPYDALLNLRNNCPLELYHW